jgi:TolA-binding protein
MSNVSTGSLLLDAFLALLTALGAYHGLLHLWDKRSKEKAKEALDQQEEFTEAEMKVQEIEAKLMTQYTELSSRVGNLEKTISKMEANNQSFEDRILRNFDKVDQKLESLRDLVIKQITNKTQ